MGKMLETLNQKPAGRGAPEAKPALLPVSAPRPDPEPEPDLPSAMSFIEVGGKLAPLDASPDVLATAPPGRTRLHPPHAERGPRLRKLAARPDDGRTVRFRPVTGGTARPRPRFAPELVAFHRPDHALSGQYQTLAEQMLAPLPADAPGILLFTAAAPGVGTTTVLLNLAVTIARHGDRQIVVIDANRDRAAVAARLGLTEAPGLGELLSGGLPLEEALQETGQAGLRALAAGAIFPSGRVRLTAEALRPLLRQLRQASDLALIDAPSWDGRPEAAVLATLADAVYLVAPAAESDSPHAGALLQVMRQQGIPVRGQILTGP
jgi:Mrp family chromosome partitioning ATPase